MNTQAHTTRRARPQRTADMRWAAPTPTIPPVMVWVVDTGMPLAEAKNSMPAAALSAHTPPIGWSRVSLVPMVRTIFHPPNMVPSAMARCDDRTTHNGTLESSLTRPAAMSRAKITPIVFCASFDP